MYGHETEGQKLVIKDKIYNFTVEVIDRLQSYDNDTGTFPRSSPPCQGYVKVNSLMFHFSLVKKILLMLNVQ